MVTMIMQRRLTGNVELHAVKNKTYNIPLIYLEEGEFGYLLQMGELDGQTPNHQPNYSLLDLLPGR